jgi:hypothetical protein
VNDLVDLVFLHRFHQGRQVTHIALHNGHIRRAQLVREKVLARRDVIKDDAFAALDGLLA